MDTVFGFVVDKGVELTSGLLYNRQILEVALFGIFTAFLLTRYIRHPALFKKNCIEFPNSSYLGAIAISWNTITQGMISYYDYRSSAAWASFVMYWVAVVLTLLVSVGIIIVQMSRAKEQSLSDVAGVWVMTTVPAFTTASTAGAILPYVNRESTKCAVAVLVTAYMIWFFAMSLLTFILTVFFFRLIANKLPQQPLLSSSFLPVAALSQGAYAIQRLSIYFATYIQSTGFGPTQVHPPPIPTSTLQATSEVMHWMGIILCLGILGHASFCTSSHIFPNFRIKLTLSSGVVQATYGMLANAPKQFSIAHWSMVFPLASYANAWCFLSRDLRNDGMRGWAATIVMVSTILWLGCAIFTSYLGFWKGSLFSAPGLEEWLGDDEQQDEKSKQRGGRKDNFNGTYTMPDPSEQGSQDDEEKGMANGRDSSGSGSESRRRS